MGLLLCYWKFVRGAQTFTEHGPLALLAPVLMLTGIHFLAIGLASEILTRTYFELQKKQIYCVRKVCRQGLAIKSPFPANSKSRDTSNYLMKSF